MTANANAGWLRGPLWDVGLIAFGWLPFYVWVGIDSAGISNWFADDTRGFTAAVAVALALNFVHRQYVLILVYGDRGARAERPRAYVIAPLLAAFVIGSVLGSANLVAKTGLVVALGLWNAWHVIQQRYGLLRVYAGRARGGLETPRAARADRALVWSSAVLMTCLTALWHVRALDGVPQAELLLTILSPLLIGPVIKGTLAAALVLWLGVAWHWWTIERNATPSARWPRGLFLLSTLALLAIFVSNGPVVGYLVLGVAHSVEYLAFVHQFGERKYAGTKSNVAAVLLGSVRRAPLVLAPLLIGYAFLYEHRFALAYVAYYTTTSALHYLYDGWIWKLRRPSVARPLGAAS